METREKREPPFDFIMGLDDHSPGSNLAPHHSQVINSSRPPTIWSQLTPTSMPWSIAACGENFPQVVRFTGSDANSTFPFGSQSPPRACKISLHSGNRNRTWLAKRKGLFENEMLPPPKVHITDEVMASQLQSMHISNTYMPHGSAVPLPSGSDDTCQRIPDLNDEGYSSDNNKLPSLVVCDELRQLQTPNILPPSLMARLESPSKALVLWKRPDPLYRPDRLYNDRKTNNDDNNSSDLHGIISKSSTQSEMGGSNLQKYAQIFSDHLTPCQVISGFADLDSSQSEDMSMSIDS